MPSPNLFTTASSQLISMSLPERTNAAHTSGLNRCTHSAAKATGLTIWSSRLIWSLSCRTMYSCSFPLRPSGRYILGLMMPMTKGDILPSTI